MIKADFECTECEQGISIEDNELYELYDNEDDVKFIDCPCCCEQIAIEVTITHSFKCVDVDDL